MEDADSKPTTDRPIRKPNYYSDIMCYINALCKHFTLHSYKQVESKDVTKIHGLIYKKRKNYFWTGRWDVRFANIINEMAATKTVKV